MRNFLFFALLFQRGNSLMHTLTLLNSDVCLFDGLGFALFRLKSNPFPFFAIFFFYFSECGFTVWFVQKNQP